MCEHGRLARDAGEHAAQTQPSKSALCWAWDSCVLHDCAGDAAFIIQHHQVYICKWRKENHNCKLYAQCCKCMGQLALCRSHSATRRSEPMPHMLILRVLILYHRRQRRQSTETSWMTCEQGLLIVSRSTVPQMRANVYTRSPHTAAPRLLSCTGQLISPPL